MLYSSGHCETAMNLQIFGEAGGDRIELEEIDIVSESEGVTDLDSADERRLLGDTGLF